MKRCIEYGVRRGETLKPLVYPRGKQSGQQRRGQEDDQQGDQRFKSIVFHTIFQGLPTALVFRVSGVIYFQGLELARL